MALHIPLTATMSCISCLTMAGAWLYMGRNISESTGAVQRPVVFIHRFFLFMALFAGVISVPYLWLSRPATFSLAMAWSYVVGHIFCYIAFMYISRMVCALVPRLSPYDRLVTVAWIVAATIVTLVNAKTMIWGTRPVYDYTLELTRLRAAPVVGASIGVLAFLSIGPAIALFIMNAIRSEGAHRVKSIILACGFLLLTIAGPMHDVARTATFYALADGLSIVSMLVIGTGVVYRLQTGLAVQKTRPAVATPTSSV